MSLFRICLWINWKKYIKIKIRYKISYKFIFNLFLLVFYCLEYLYIKKILLLTNLKKYYTINEIIGVFKT